MSHMLNPPTHPCMHAPTVLPMPHTRTCAAVQADLDALQQQLSAAEALVCAHSTRQQQHAEACSNTQQELLRHAAAAQAAGAKRAAAEEEVQQLRARVAEQQGRLEGREQELREARSQLQACQVGWVHDKAGARAHRAYDSLSKQNGSTARLHTLF